MPANRPSFSPTSRHSALRAEAMVVGAGVLFWRTRSGWSLGLTCGAGLLLILALFVPAGYAPINRALDWLQQRTVQAFSWCVLGLVFAVIFIPGRFVLSLRGGGRIVRNKKSGTYWEACPSTSRAESFERQF